jgi:energy-coupling factor transporter ATP-binding protein EcfA2
MSTVHLRGFGWRHAGRKAWAVRDVDLTIEHGERVLLLGASGAGKSTLLAALGGLLAEDSGEQEGTVSVAGDGNRGIGVVFQDPQTQLVMSRAGDDVAFGLENLGVPAEEIWPRVKEALHAVGFPYGLDRDTGALSGGEQQRLAIAGVLATRPGLLLLDEPTANLDPAGADLVREALRRSLDAYDATVVLVEHRVSEALPLVDRVVVLAPGGGILADGAPEKVFRENLADQGVWVPGVQHPRRPATKPVGATLLTSSTVDIKAGRITAIVGPNGAGKTTLALALGGLTKNETVRWQAERPYKWRAKKLATRIGSVFQDPEHQFVTGRVRDELALGPRRTGQPESIVDELLVRLRLDKLALANPYTLSGGEQRRLSVATALATAPEVLILDEPTFGQDLRTWRELANLIADLRDEGRGIALVTHDADLVEAVADERLELST